jgi:hypothetical protein
MERKWATVTLKRYVALEDGIAAVIGESFDGTGAEKEALLAKLMECARSALGFDPDAYVRRVREDGAKQRARDKQRAEAEGISINAVRDSAKRERFRAAQAAAVARTNRFKEVLGVEHQNSHG